MISTRKLLLKTVETVGRLNFNVLSVERGGTNANNASDARKNLNIFPVGSIYMSTTNTNPSAYFGGTWVSWGSGRVPVGIDTSQSEFNAVEKTGGEKTHTLTIDEIPSHNHQMYGTYSNGTGSASAYMQTNNRSAVNVNTGNRGGGATHNNLQPYITCYMWKRTA